MAIIINPRIKVNVFFPPANKEPMLTEVMVNESKTESKNAGSNTGRYIGGSHCKIRHNTAIITKLATFRTRSMANASKSDDR